MHFLRRGGCFWPLYPFVMRNKDEIPALVFSCRFTTHLSECGGLVRRCCCDEMFWGLYQACSWLIYIAIFKSELCLALFSYLIIIKGLMPNVVETLYHDLTSEDTNPPEWALHEQNWLFVFLFILAPLSFLRHINSLRHTSYIALFAVGKWVTVWDRNFD